MSVEKEEGCSINVARGNATIQYDSCWINSVGQSFPLKLVTTRELIY